MKKQNKPQLDLTRPLSWSSLSCFDNPDYPEYSDREEWYRRYVLGIKSKPSREMTFGSQVDFKIQNDPAFLPELERYPVQQFHMKPTYKGIPLIGYGDQFDPFKRLADDKTGKTPWTQKRADKTGQLTMYLAMIYLEHKINPEKIKLAIRWLPTVQDADLTIRFAKPFAIQTFNTKRTLPQILKFLAYIERTRKAMIEYAENHE